MKIVDSISVLFYFAFIASSVAIDEPESLATKHRELEFSLGAFMCQSKLRQCLVSNGPDPLPLDEWKSLLQGVSNDPGGVSAQLISVVEDAGLVDFNAMFEQLEDPIIAANLFAEGPAMLETVASIKPTKDNIDESIQALTDVTTQFANAFWVGCGVCETLIAVLVSGKLWVYAGLFVVGVLTFIGIFIAIFIGTFFKRLMDKHIFDSPSAACEADLLLCEYEALLSNVIPTFISGLIAADEPEAP